VLEGIRYLFATISSKIRVVQLHKIEETNLVWKCRFEYTGIPITSLDFSFYDGIGQTDGKVKNGLSTMTFFFPERSKKEREIDLAVEFKALDEMDDLLKFAEEMTQSKFSSKTIVLVLGSEENMQSMPEKKKEFAGIDKSKIKGIPKSIQEVLSQNTSLKNVLDALRTMVKKKRIIIGRREDFESLDGMFGLVLDDNGITALIVEQKGNWADLLHSRTVETKELVGRKITWIETHEK